MLSSSDRQLRLRTLVDVNVRFVRRTLRNAGVPGPEIDDETQRTFMVASSRIDDVEFGAERSFLFQVAVHTAWHARRTLARRREVVGKRVPDAVEMVATPEHLTERKQMRRLLDDIIALMSEHDRTAFRLQAFEDMTTAEIADLLDVPRGTVASRLRRARARFRKHVDVIRRNWGIALPGPAVGTHEGARGVPGSGR